MNNIGWVQLLVQEINKKKLQMTLFVIYMEVKISRPRFSWETLMLLKRCCESKSLSTQETLLRIQN